MALIRHINNIGVEHHIQYNQPDPWTRKNGAYYKVDYPIDNQPYFVKRYVGQLTVPSGSSLIMALRGKSVTNLPFTYDFVKQKEGNLDCFYYVSAHISGDTLDVWLDDAEFVAQLDLQQLAAHLMAGLDTIFQQGFWFGDLNEQNIMFSPKNKTFYLIDLDSCWHQSVKPNGDEKESGGLPVVAQGYASLAVQWIREAAGLLNLEIEDLDGKTINYLQLLTFISRLNCFKSGRKAKLNRSFTDTFNLVHEHLTAAIPNFGNYIKENTVTQKIDSQVFIQEFQSLLTKVIRQSADAPKARILELNALPRVFKATDTVVLNWKTENAQKVLMIGGHFGLSGVEQNAFGSLQVKPSEDTTYLLKVIDAKGESTTKTIQIQLDKSVAKPEIISFKVSRTQLEAEKPLHLVWWVQNAEKVFLNGDAVEPKGHQILTLTKNTTLKLIARNGEETSVVQEIKIEVAQKKMPVWAKAAMIAIPLLIGSFWFGKGLYINQLSPNEAFQKGQQAFKNNDFTAALPYLKRAEVASNKPIGNGLIPQAGNLNSSEQADCYYYLAKSCIELKQETDACQWVEEGLKKSQSNALMALCVYNKCNCSVSSSIPKNKTSN
jgi:hypothetical protein